MGLKFLSEPHGMNSVYPTLVAELKAQPPIAGFHYHLSMFCGLMLGHREQINLREENLCSKLLEYPENMCQHAVVVPVFIPVKPPCTRCSAKEPPLLIFAAQHSA